MKNYTITVNGNVYDVMVEEKGATTTSKSMEQITPSVIPVVQAPVATQQAQGVINIEAGAAGKVFKIVANVGQAVKKGDTVIILEAMKMEIPMVASEDGTVASITVAVGDAVEAGMIIATLN